MADKKPFDDAKAMWTKMSMQKRVMIIAAAVVTLGGAAIIAQRGSAEPYSTLYSGLQPEDAGKVLEALKAQNSPYHIENGGTSIEVPTTRVAELRITLAQSGLPRGGGLGYELFDKQTFGTSSFLEQVNYRRALQGELERSILAIDAIARARVHLVAQERSLYKEQEEAATASVIIGLKGGQSLAEPQVRGIVHLVAASVQGLTPEHVSVVDERGVSLWNGEEGAGSAAVPEVERSLSRRVREILERVVGPGHAQVVVTADVDATQLERTEEVFDKDRSAIRSESRNSDGAPSSAPATAGVAGAQGNLPGAPSASTSTTGGANAHVSETRNFEVTRTVSHSISPKSHIKRLHVAVLLDGVRKDAKDPKSAVVPRSAEEVARITALAREAAGIDTERGDKIEVLSTAFATDADDVAANGTAPVWKDKRVMIAAAVGLGVIFLMAVMLMAKRGRKNQAFLMPSRTLPMSVSQLENEMEPAPEVHRPALELAAPQPRDRANNAVKLDAARAARVLTAWVAENSRVEASGDRQGAGR